MAKVADPSRKNSVALVLGGGGARGLAHIVALEALDEAGIRPVSITGTSIGAVIGAAYAAGVSGKALRRHAQTMLRDRTEVMAKMFAARVGKLGDLFSQGLGNPLLVDGEMVLDQLMPGMLPASFTDLAIPFRAIATDYYARARKTIDQGALKPAVAASMALPWMVRPVRIDGRIMVDGGAVDPLPFDMAASEADLVLAIDVTGDFVSEDEQRLPSPIDGMIGMSTILQIALMDMRRARAPANVRILRAPVQRYGLLDFFKAKRILAEAEPLRNMVAAALAS